MINKEHIVLLGSSGVGAAFASAKALRKHFNVKIIAVDTNPSYLVTSNLFADYYHQVLPVADISFEDELVKIINDHDIDTYIPFIDQEVLVAASLYNKGKINDKICLQVKDPKLAEICADKHKTYDWLKSKGLHTPKTFLVDGNTELIDGYILKPRYGYGSVIEIIENGKNHKVKKGEEFIMQEICNYPEITIDVHYSKTTGFLEYACRERIETKSGVCTKARIFKERALGEMAFVLAKGLSLSSFCFQVMTLENNFVITDINPRLGGGTAISVAVGFDFFGAMFADLWGQNTEEYFTKLDNETYVTRQYCEFVM